MVFFSTKCNQCCSIEVGKQFEKLKTIIKNNNNFDNHKLLRQLFCFQKTLFNNYIFQIDSQNCQKKKKKVSRPKTNECEGR